MGTILGYPVRKMGYTGETEITARVHNLLDVVGLPRRYIDRYSFQLSGGELQRVALARTLALEPEFIVCDEPTSAVDMNVKVQILKLLADIQPREGDFSPLYLARSQRGPLHRRPHLRDVSGQGGGGGAGGAALRASASPVYQGAPGCNR